MWQFKNFLFTKIFREKHYDVEKTLKFNFGLQIMKFAKIKIQTVNFVQRATQNF